jgi:hypothetical protein
LPASRSAGAAADHREAQPAQFLGARGQRFPARGEPVDRFDRNRVLDGAGNIVALRGNADIQRHQIIADRRVITAQHVASGAVEANRFVMDQPRAGETRQAQQIDMAFGERIMPGDIAGQHPRIGGLDIAGDEGEAHAGDRPHPEPLQHMDMGMPAADEHEVPVDRNARLHRATMPERGPYRLIRGMRSGKRCCGGEYGRRSAPGSVQA